MELLNGVLHDTVNSVVQYIGISGAYVPEKFDEQLQELERLRAEEVQTAHDINEALFDLDVPPRVGVFEYWNVDLNYLDVRFLARFAARHQQRSVARLEQGIHSDEAREHPRVHALLTRVLEQKREHLATLKRIGGEEAAAPAEAAPEPKAAPSAEG
jgi:bacterioferritin (cytochrome b1)